MPRGTAKGDAHAFMHFFHFADYRVFHISPFSLSSKTKGNFGAERAQPP